MAEKVSSLTGRVKGHALHENSLVDRQLKDSMGYDARHTQMKCWNATSTKQRYILGGIDRRSDIGVAMQMVTAIHLAESIYSRKNILAGHYE